MRKIWLFLFIAIVASCDRIPKPPSEEELLKKELQSINWEEVDEYPSVPECDKLEDKELRRSCFFDFLANTLQQKLNVDTLSVLYPNLDTIQVKVTVFPDSTMKFEPQFPSDSVTYDMGKVDSLLRARTADLPRINPAIKRGMPVKSQFILPVILQKEK